MAHSVCLVFILLVVLWGLVGFRNAATTQKSDGITRRAGTARARFQTDTFGARANVALGSARCVTSVKRCS